MADSDARVQDVVGEKVDFLFGKIDRGFDVHARFGHRFGQRMNRDRKLTLQRTKRGTCGLARAAVDEIGNGFGLGEIDLVVQEGALCEFARLRDSRAETEYSREQHIHDDGAAMAMQLQDIFAGE